MLFGQLNIWVWSSGNILSWIDTADHQHVHGVWSYELGGEHLGSACGQKSIRSKHRGRAGWCGGTSKRGREGATGICRKARRPGIWKTRAGSRKREWLGSKAVYRTSTKRTTNGPLHLARRRIGNLDQNSSDGAMRVRAWLGRFKRHWRKVIGDS